MGEEAPSSSSEKSSSLSSYVLRLLDGATLLLCENRGGEGLFDPKLGGAAVSLRREEEEEKLGGVSLLLRRLAGREGVLLF